MYKNLDIISFVLGIIALILSFVPIINILFAIVTIVCSVISRRREKRWFSMVGMILGIIVLLISIFIFVVYITTTIPVQ